VRILYIMNGLNGGGAAFPVPDLVRVMRAAGHEVRVIALMRQDGLACAHLDAAGIDYRIIGKGPKDIIGSARNLISAIRAFRPDIIWTSLTRATIFGQLAGRLFGIPVVSWQHNAWLKPANLAILRRTRRLSRHWVVDSDAVADYTADTIGVDRTAIHVWPIFMVDPERPPPARPHRDTFTVGSLGRLHRNKQYSLLIDIAAHIRDHHPAAHGGLSFVVAGEGGERKALEARVGALALDNVRFIGFRRDTDAFFQEIDAYIQPSHHEGMCIALHEAMAAALPVIATPVGQMRHSITPDCGALHESGDVEGFARSILALAGDRGLAARQGAAARRRVIDCFNEGKVRTMGTALLSRLEAECAVSARTSTPPAPGQ
jgi:glycosyltransferase involved in cell wall biosynthesis